MTATLPVTAIVPTRDRGAALRRMLMSLSAQSAQPIEMVIVDASSSDETARLCAEGIPNLATVLVHVWANEVGAASQRNEGLKHASQDVVVFFDDDILFEPDCLVRLAKALESDSSLGGVNAMIVNQRYGQPGLVSRTLYRVLDGRDRRSYAGLCIGPALNLLPEDSEELPEIVPVDWLNLGCTMYRTAALPLPAFPKHFTGYSLMEDLALSLWVGKKWKLANVPRSKIYHDSQPGEHKSNVMNIARMELVNRYYIMSRLLDRTRWSDYAKLCLLEVFGITTPLVSSHAWRSLPSALVGKVLGVWSIFKMRRDSTRSHAASLHKAEGQQ